MFKFISQIAFACLFILCFSVTSAAQISGNDATSFFFDHKPNKVDKIKIYGISVANFNPETVRLRTLDSSLQIKDKETGREIYISYASIKYLFFEPKVNSKGNIIISVIDYSE